MISIIGAGPAGSFAAYNLAKAGYDVNLYEDNLKIGKPVQCTGICTSALESIVPLKKELVMNKIKHAKIVAPNNDSVTISMKNPNIILTRSGFDEYIGNLAHDAGADIQLGHRFTSAQKEILLFKHKGEIKEEKRGDYIIGADGPNTTVGKTFNLTKQHTIMQGAQASVKMDIAEDTLEFYPIPEGYRWVVPEGNGVARVGLAVYSKPSDHFKAFLKNRCPEDKIVEYQGGVIPKYNPSLQTFDKKNNVLLLGDAATQVKWTTGGGIIQGLIAAKAATKAIEHSSNYDELWRQTLGRDLWLHLQVRNMMDRFTNKDYNKLIALTNQEKIRNILATHDRDFITQFLVKTLLKEPRYLLFAKNILRKPSYNVQN